MSATTQLSARSDQPGSKRRVDSLAGHIPAPGPISGYFGSKGGNGVAQRIVSLMPDHETYVEMGLGGGAVFRLKRPASRSFLVDIDDGILERWNDFLNARSSHETTIEAGRHCPTVKGGEKPRLDREGGSHSAALAIHADMTRPETWPSSLRKAMEASDTVAYFDPPYLGSTRTDLTKGYRHDMQDEVDHRRLLRVLRSLPCKVLISGYYSSLYASMLQDWRSHDFWAGTRGGKRREWVWMNYPEPAKLHDTRFVGEGFRERERIKRKTKRWVSMLMAMTPAERQAIIEAVREL